VTQGKTATDTITITDVSPFTGSVTLAATGLPSGVTVAYGTNPTTSTSVLTFTASSTATTGAATVTIKGTSGSLTATTTITLTVVASGTGSACTVDYAISPQNSSQFGATLSIINNGTTTLSNWSLTWTFANGQTISSSWNGTVSQSGANVKVSEQSGQTWENIPAGGRYSGFGFNGTWNGVTNAVPTAFSLNGTACTIN
jgi:mannan endo-1,4-beta-mannosidase